MSRKTFHDRAAAPRCRLVVVAALPHDEFLVVEGVEHAVFLRDPPGPRRAIDNEQLIVWQFRGARCIREQTREKQSRSSASAKADRPGTIHSRAPAEAVREVALQTLGAGFADAVDNVKARTTPKPGQTTDRSSMLRSSAAVASALRAGVGIRWATAGSYLKTKACQDRGINAAPSSAAGGNTPNSDHRTPLQAVKKYGRGVRALEICPASPATWIRCWRTRRQ